MTSNGIDISRVLHEKDMREFLRLPGQLYRNDPYWVPPLIRNVRQRLTPSKHPFFEHARMELFLARRAAEVVGRIAAIIDDRHNAYHCERTGFFGMFECVHDPEVARRLFSAAEVWCRNEGMDRIRGPMNLSMNDECGFLLEGFKADPVLMMTYNPKYYINLCESCGYHKVKDLYAYLKSDVGVVDRVATLMERMKTHDNISIRSLNMRNYEYDVGLIKEIYNSAWELNWGFVPMTDREMDHMAKELRPIVEPELVLFAEVAGKPVGVSITLPDYNQVIKHLKGRIGALGLLKWFYYRNRIAGLRNIIFGIKKEYRRTGISMVLYYETEKAAARLGYRWCEMSWTLEDNRMINRLDEALGGKLYKKYRIYEKGLVGG